MIDLYNSWLVAKDREKQITAERRDIEDQIKAVLEVDESIEGTVSTKEEGLKVTITPKLSRSIDSAKLQEIALEHGLESQLSELFNWKPSINMKRWKDTSPEITGPLLGAITTKPSRATFKIERK